MNETAGAPHAGRASAKAVLERAILIGPYQPRLAMVTVRRAQPADIEPALAALVDAFAADPLISYFFGDQAQPRRAAVHDFFSILLRARLALDMPAFVVEDGQAIVGAAMGYDTTRPQWPEAITREWQRFEAGLPGFAARLAAYEKICDSYQPTEPHYYLGVIGIQPTAQGKGVGKALLDVFCAQSLANPASRGVFLETASPASFKFYYRNGFELRGEGDLGTIQLQCVFRPNQNPGD